MHAEDAVNAFNSGCNCAEAIVTTFGEEYGFVKQDLMRIASGFGGGIGRLGEVCGAVSGAIMILGLRYGRTEAGDNETKEVAYAKVKEFAARFTNAKGSIICNELLGFIMTDPEQYAAGAKSGVFRTVCPSCVRAAAEVLDTML